MINSQINKNDSISIKNNPLFANEAKKYSEWLYCSSAWNTSEDMIVKAFLDGADFLLNYINKQEKKSLTI